MFATLQNSVTEQLALFEDYAGPSPAGLRYSEGLLSPAEEEALVAAFARLNFSPFKFRGYEGKRRVASFGWGYDFVSGQPIPAPELPAWLSPLRERAAIWAGIVPETLQQATVIEYGPGAPIGWHRDRPIYEDVVGVSLLSSRTLRLRRRMGAAWERASLTLSLSAERLRAE